MHNVKFMIILIISIFFSFQVRKVQENLITWFLPFYNKGTKELTVNTPPFITSNLVYNQLKFEYIKYIYFFIYNKNTNNEIDNYYNFLISNLIKTTKIENIITRSAIGPINSDSNIFGEDLLRNIEILNNFKIERFYDDDQVAIEKLRNKQIDGMVFTDLYPSNFLNKIFEQDLDKTFFILPLKNINQELFKKIHPFVKNVAIDLNALPKNYLPIKVNNLEYTSFRPNLDTFQYPVLFICNKDAKPIISYEIVKGVVNNLDVLNKSDMTLKNQWNYLALPDIANDNFIPTHIGAKTFYNQLTVNTTNPDELCKYYIGKKKCGPEDIESAKIIMGDD